MKFEITKEQIIAFIKAIGKIIAAFVGDILDEEIGDEFDEIMGA